MHLLLVLALFAFVPAAGGQQPLPSDAYADARARELVALARARRAVVDNRIHAYQVTAHERISARLGAAWTERLAFRRETAARIDWTRDTVRIEVVGAREAQPLVTGGTRLPPPDVAGTVGSLAFDPVDSEMLIRLDSAVLRHPLSVGSEAFYRFAIGDSMTVRFPAGRRVRLRELRVTARRPDSRLINGSFWIDAETHALVRAGFRPSRAYTSHRSGVNVGMPEVGGELEHVAIEYGLWDLRWWLPRSVVARGVVRVAGTRFPLAYERRYDGYQVQGDTSALTGAALAVERGPTEPPDSLARPCRPRTFGSIQMGSGAPSDSAWAAGWTHSVQRAAAGDTAASGGRRPCRRPFVVTRADVPDLAASPVFTAGLYQPSEALAGQAELQALGELVQGIPSTPWGFSRPGVELLTPETVRFNRVEGLALAARAALPLGPAELRAELRAGTTGEFGARIGAVRTGGSLRTEGAVYRGLEAVQVASHPFSLSSSLSALVLGRDENDYFRGTGVELRISPAASLRRSWDARLFAERQEAVRAKSDLSIRGWIDEGYAGRENLRADAAYQLGGTLGVRAARGDDPAALRTRAELELHGEAGDFAFGRPLLRLNAEGRLPWDFGYGLSATAGTTFGEVPVQRLWQIGGASSVRGHDAGKLRGSSLWLARGELTAGPPMIRVSAFGDAGWTGDLEALAGARPLRGAGVGVALLDGLVRVDLARGLVGGGTRLYVRLGGSM